MNNLDPQYQTLLQDIIEFGVEKKDRTGTGTKSIFGYTIHHNMRNGFPLLTTKKVAFKTMATELMWFLMGDTNIKYLQDNNCHIWDGDYNKSGRTDGELGPIYGKQWRRWTKKKMYLSTDGSYENIYDEMDQTVIDQIAGLINELKTNPDSRRLMVSAWNVGELDQMVLPPCHYGFQVYTRELSESERFNWYGNKIGSHMHHDHIIQEMNENNVPTRAISLLWNQRSVDVFLGLPFNIASYGLLLEMIAREVNMVPEHLIGHLGDTHLYSNHIEQAKEQMSRDHKELPVLKMSSGHNFRAALKGKADEIDLNDFILIGYEPHPTIKAPLSN